MSEFLEQGVKFGMRGCTEKVLEDPTDGLLGFGGGGFGLREVLDVASLIAVEGRTEFEQDESWSADEADFEVFAVFKGVDVLPEAGGKQGDIEAIQGGGSVEPIRTEAKLGGDLGGGLLHRHRQWIGAHDIAFPFAHSHHIHVLGWAVAQTLRQLCAAASTTSTSQTGAQAPSARHSPRRRSAWVRSRSFIEILFAHPKRTFQQYL